MRLLVLSDSHGKRGAIERIIDKERSAKHVFFLGDVISDIDDIRYEFPDRQFHIVAGNCDYYSPRKTFDTVTLGGKKILFAHGHNFSVKCGTLDRLLKFAESESCDIVLYGHTHIPDIDYKNGIYLINPGSVGRSRDGAESYAAIDITESGVLPQIIRI